MDSKQKKYWLSKIENGSDEKILMDILLSEGGLGSFSEMYEIYNASNELKHWKKFDTQKAWDRINKQTSSSRLMFLKYVSAAMILFVVGISLLLFNINTRYSAGNIERHLVLSDGSDIILYPNSELIISDGFNQKIREVKLEGDAYFNISKNKNKPFIIKMNKANIKVLGTVFYVEQSEKELKVDLISGKVEIEDKDGDVAVLTKNKTAFITDKVEVRSLNEERIQPIGDLFLDNVSIQTAVDKFNGIYGGEIIKLEESESKLWDERIHMTVRNSSIREFINGLELIFNVKVINSKGKFIVSSLKMK